MLKNKRVDAGRTQEEIAELLEISLELYAEIESNPDEASYKILSKIYFSNLFYHPIPFNYVFGIINHWWSNEFAIHN